MSESSRPFVVMIRFSVHPDDVAELSELVTEMIMEIGPFLASQPGFLGFRSHRSLDGSEVVNLIQWKGRADHEAAMSHPEMESAGGGLMEWVESGRATLATDLYEIASDIAPPA